MPNTYAQIYVHLVFAVALRDAMISQEWEAELYRYFGTVIEDHGHHSIIINGMPDHVHIFISLNPKESIADLVKAMKQYSTLWINKNRLCRCRFAWQSGYGAFSYGQSQIETVCKYIQNQKAHHKKQKFVDEYKRFLKLFHVEYNPDYILHEPK
jgi:REP element-mobilizing transposase RayT